MSDTTESPAEQRLAEGLHWAAEHDVAEILGEDREAVTRFCRTILSGQLHGAIAALAQRAARGDCGSREEVVGNLLMESLAIGISIGYGIRANDEESS